MMPAAGIDVSFDPSGRRAKQLDDRMRVRLAQSLRYLVDVSAAALAFEPARLHPFLARLEAASVPPLIFGAYYELVLALETGELDEARLLLEEIVSAPDHAGGPRIVDLADPGTEPGSDRYVRLTATDLSFPFELHPPPEDVSRRCRGWIAEAFSLMERGDPDLAEEIRGLLREIVLAVGSDDPKANNFDGSSSFMLWGAIVLNARNFSTALNAAETLAHESGHNLLFGLCADGPLIDNDDEARYVSPLRTDLRPMDGIVHATYVTARMHRAVSHLLHSGVLEPGQQDVARSALTAHARNFAAGMQTIDREAKLTALGRSVLDGACAYMAAQ